MQVLKWKEIDTHGQTHVQLAGMPNAYWAVHTVLKSLKTIDYEYSYQNATNRKYQSL